LVIEQLQARVRGVAWSSIGSAEHEKRIHDTVRMIAQQKCCPGDHTAHRMGEKEDLGEVLIFSGRMTYGRGEGRGVEKKRR